MNRIFILCLGIIIAVSASAQTPVPDTDVIYRCTAQPFGAPPVCSKTGLAQATARIYKCVHRPDGGLNCSTVVFAAPTTPQELTAVLQAAVTGLETAVLDPLGNIDINAHGHSANCHIIGHNGATVYVECDSVTTAPSLPIASGFVSGAQIQTEGCVPTICKCRCPRTTPAL